MLLLWFYVNDCISFGGSVLICHFVGCVVMRFGGNSKYNIKANCIAPVATTRMTEAIFGEEIKEAMNPELVTPVVCFLAHEDCPVSGEVYSAAGGTVARFFIGRTPGYYNRCLACGLALIFFPSEAAAPVLKRHLTFFPHGFKVFEVTPIEIWR